MNDLRKKPWRKVRVVIEVTVPPTNRTDEADLAYMVGQWMPHTLALPRPIHRNHHNAAVRIKHFTPYYRREKITERKNRK